jgi:hypothetical protein
LCNINNKKNSMAETRKKATFTLDPDVITALQEAAKQDGRSASRYLEALIFTHCGMRPKPPKPPLKPAKQV